MVVFNDDPRLTNADLLPAKERGWGSFSIASTWMAFVHSLGNYTVAATLFILGLNAWEVLLAYAIGYVLLFVFANWSGWMGQKHGVPYAVLARVSLGVFGANIAALVRAVVAVVWYGIQTYLASSSVIVLLASTVPGAGGWVVDANEHTFLGLSWIGWLAFLFVWALQLLVVRHGMEVVRRFQNIVGPLVWVVMLTLMVLLLFQAGPKLDLSASGASAAGADGTTPGLLGAGFSALILYGVFAAFNQATPLVLSSADFERFGKTRRSITWGNFWGLPVNGAAFGVISAITTAAGLAVYGKVVADPAELLSLQSSTAVVVIGAILLLIATMGVNIAGNVISASYDLVNVFPKWLTFPRATMLVSLVALFSLPWKIFATPTIIVYFLGVLGAILGPLFGLIIVDYYWVRRQQIHEDQLFTASPAGAYYYRRGVNPGAVVVLGVSGACSSAIAVVPALADVAPYSWIVGALLAATLHYLFNRTATRHPSQRSGRSTGDEYSCPEPQYLEANDEGAGSILKRP